MVPSLIIRCAAAKAKPVAVQPPDLTEALTVSRRRSGVTTKPSVRPGATFFERLSITRQLSGASAAKGGSSSRKP